MTGELKMLGGFKRSMVKSKVSFIKDLSNQADSIDWTVQPRIKKCESIKNNRMRQ